MKNKIAIHCKTEWEYNELMKYYENVKQWQCVNLSCKPTLTNLYGTYRELTCIEFNNFFHYGDLAYYKDHNHTVIPFQHLAAIAELNITETIDLENSRYATINYANQTVTFNDENVYTFDIIKNLAKKLY